MAATVTEAMVEATVMVAITEAAAILTVELADTRTVDTEAAILTVELVDTRMVDTEVAIRTEATGAATVMVDMGAATDMEEGKFIACAGNLYFKNL